MSEERNPREESYTEPEEARHGDGESRAGSEEAKERARQASREAGEAAQRMGRELGHRGWSMARQQQEMVADRLDRIGEAFHQTAERMYGSNETSIAVCMDSTADRAHGVASYLRDREPRELMDEATHYARQHPVLVVGGALLLGYAATRVVKAAWSAEQDESWQSPTEEPVEAHDQPGSESTSPEESQRGTSVPPAQP